MSGWFFHVSAKLSCLSSRRSDSKEAPAFQRVNLLYNVCLGCSARVSPLALRKLTKHARSQKFGMYVVAGQRHRVSRSSFVSHDSSGLSVLHQHIASPHCKMLILSCPIDMIQVFIQVCKKKKIKHSFMNGNGCLFCSFVLRDLMVCLLQP